MFNAVVAYVNLSRPVPSRPIFTSIMGIKHPTQRKIVFLTLFLFCELHKILTTQF